MQPETVIPVLMSCALLWWISRSMDWSRRLVAAAITLVIIVAVLLVERAMQ